MGFLCACETVSRGACPPVQSAGVFTAKVCGWSWCWRQWTVLTATGLDAHFLRWQNFVTSIIENNVAPDRVTKLLVA